MSETIDAPVVDAAPEASAPDAADDLRAALAGAYDEHDTSEEVESRARDDRGRFAAHERETTEVVDHEPPVDETQAEVKTDALKAEATEETRPALPPEMAPVKDVLDQYKHLYAAKGVAPEAAVKALFDAEIALRSNPEQAFPALAQAFGFDIMRWAAARMAPAQNEQAPAMPADPAYQALVAKVQQLESHLSATEQRAQQQAHQAQAATIQRVIDEFAADPKHAHFPAVESMMAALISSGQAKDMPTAYDMACRAHPDVYKAITQAEQATAAKARQRDAAEAKSRAVSVRGTPSVNGFAQPPEDLRSLLGAVMDGRVN